MPTVDETGPDPVKALAQAALSMRYLREHAARYAQFANKLQDAVDTLHELEAASQSGLPEGLTAYAFKDPARLLYAYVGIFRKEADAVGRQAARYERAFLEIVQGRMTIEQWVEAISSDSDQEP